jgi:hypothetical protein
MVQRLHFSQFMINQIPVAFDASQDMSDFVEKEPEYDLAFCKSWEFASLLPAEAFSTGKNFLESLDKIQDLALSHLPEKLYLDDEKQQFIFLRGRASFINGYGLAKNTCSDDNGILDIIDKIIYEKRNLRLHCILDMPESRYVLSGDGFKSIKFGFERLAIGRRDERWIYRIKMKFLKWYNKGFLSDGSDRIFIEKRASKEEREKEALAYIHQFLRKMNRALLPIEKIRNIAILIRDLMQIHLYFDGNGRALYILSNILLNHYNLPLFYPKNMCLFDGNSVEKMVEEILIGQQTFKAHFKDKAELTKNLKNYAQVISELGREISEKYSEYPSLAMAFKQRNLNLVFRKLAATKKALPLLKYMTRNITVLGIDPTVRGLSSGTALDVAIKFSNTKAIPILIQVCL